jgi:hypothetical protein
METQRDERKEGGLAMDSYTADTEMAEAHADSFRVNMRVVLKSGEHGRVIGVWNKEVRCVVVLVDGAAKGIPYETDYLEREDSPMDITRRYLAREIKARWSDIVRRSRDGGRR